MKRIIDLLENLDDILQVCLAFLLFGAATTVLIYAGYDFVMELSKSISHAIVLLIHEILLIMIALELLFTVLTYLKEHVIPLEPFLIIGIISSLRKILIVGAQVSIFEAEGIGKLQFQQYLMELGLHALIVITLVIALFLIKKYQTFRVTGR